VRCGERERCARTATVTRVVACELALMRYLVLPWRVWNTPSSRLDPTIESVPLAELPTDMAERLESYYPTLTSLGFHLLGNLVRKDAHPTAEGCESTWANPKTQHVALIVYAKVRRGVSLPSLCVAFQQRYADRMTVITSNARTPSIFDHEAALDVAIWQTNDIGWLYDLHVRRAAAVRGRRTPVVPSDENVIRYASEDGRRIMEYQVQRGLLWVNREEKRYRYTLWGAYVMTWRMLWPLKQLRAKARARRTIRIARELGMTLPPEDAGTRPGLR
jgi:hypothetical protein